MSDFSTIPTLDETREGDYLLLGRANATNPAKVLAENFKQETRGPSTFHMGPLPPEGPEQLWFRTDGLGTILDSWGLKNDEWRSIQGLNETRYLPAFQLRSTDAFVGLEIAGLDKKVRVINTLIAATPMQDDSDILTVDLEAYGPNLPPLLLASEQFGPFAQGVEERREVAVNQTLPLGYRLRFKLNGSGSRLWLAGISVSASLKLVY